MHMGHVNLYDRDLKYVQSIGDAMAVMRPGTGVNEHGIRPVPMGLVDPLGHLTFVVGLETLHFKAQFPAESFNLFVYLGEGKGTVLFRIPSSEHIQVYSVKNKQFMHVTSRIMERVFS
jgi:hypothetical protein